MRAANTDRYKSDQAATWTCDELPSVHVFSQDDSMMYTHALLLLLSSVFVHALPLISRDVISPPITSPTAGTIWTVGQTVTVTWNTTDIPTNASQITNPIGKIVLGYQANNSLNLDLDNPLASNFQLTDGHADITVPDVEPRDDYIIVLFGDSGNTSPKFTIQRSTFFKQ
ncbi:uncharacterized protein EV420DRAFT_1040246 [Desarmillaria tabescens]|uniref:Yeast cell wall synthesis Kre9/Knh1-like N-terminal domain-containing protein n=1 Tax=Armillaria tabescens TaxID=1929756 RepID=A0AA39NEZ9_ARMTA|nr:uncharacterized protein EV420DRAFT_1040246 [Desarmillaria tabescens]KAK0464409.1 hypothetical protein EV420DRAFT_1040246 [Desarmillaria tabescens]